MGTAAVFAAWAGPFGSPLRVGEGPGVRSLRGRKRFSIFLFPSLLACLLAALALCGCKPERKEAPPPIVLIVIDTLRADHVGAYGYARPTTPSLDRFAATAIRFANAHAAASWTVPSMASLFTGAYPWDHGVVKAKVTDSLNQVDFQLTLNDKFVTLASTLRAAGYETFGVSANYHMHERYGMAQGFDHYKAFGFVDRRVVDQQVGDWLGRLAEARRQRRPYFLYVHYMDPHHPYLPIEPYISEWRPKYDKDEIASLHEKLGRHELQVDYFLARPAAMGLLADLYDSGVKAADDSVGKLLAALPDLAHTTVVITADHGEAFGDHKNMIHGPDLFGETMRVPLLVQRADGARAGAVVDENVSLVDVYPTLANLAGAKRPSYLVGVDLFGPAAKAPRTFFAATHYLDDDPVQAVVRAPYKLVVDLRTMRAGLFDISADPKEKKNLAEEQPALVNELLAALAKARRPRPLFPPGNAGAIDPTLRQQLKSLGYI